MNKKCYLTIEIEKVKYDSDNFEGDLKTIISDLQSKLDEGWDGIKIDSEYEFGHSDPVSYFYLYKTRLETDDEYEDRMKRQEKCAEDQRKLKLKQYLELKKELGYEV